MIYASNPWARLDLGKVQILFLQVIYHSEKAGRYDRPLALF